MAVVKVYDQNRQTTGDANLDPEVFEVDVRPEILNFVVRAQRAAKRAGTSSAKSRAFVSGGGVKPWKQKGTGRARAGSNRSPLWRGGAIVFGPTPRSYEFKVNRKVRALAMRMALSSRLADNSLLVVKDIALAEKKTKAFAQVAKTLGMDKALVILPEANETLERCARNIPGITLMTPDQLNVYSILKHPQLVVFEQAIAPIESRLK